MTLLGNNVILYLKPKKGEKMAKYVVICEADECETENEDYEYRNGTYWFTCVKCGFDNEVVEVWY